MHIVECFAGVINANVGEGLLCDAVSFDVGRTAFGTRATRWRGQNYVANILRIKIVVAVGFYSQRRQEFHVDTCFGFFCSLDVHCCCRILFFGFDRLDVFRNKALRQFDAVDFASGEIRFDFRFRCA